MPEPTREKTQQGQVREAVEDVLNVFLEEEATALCGAAPYQRTEERKDYRNGHRVRKLVTRAGEVRLKVARLRELAAAIKAVHAQESADEARAKAQRLFQRYERKFPAAMKVLREGLEETLPYYRFPSRHWRNLRTTSVVERLIGEGCRRTDVAGAFSKAQSARLLVCARVPWVTERSWGTKRYIRMKASEEEEETGSEEVSLVR